MSKDKIRTIESSGFTYEGGELIYYTLFIDDTKLGRMVRKAARNKTGKAQSGAMFVHARKVPADTPQRLKNT